MSDLKALREEQNMTMKQVADKADISESFYSLIESGKRRPSVEKAKVISSILNYDWTKFYDPSPDTQYTPQSR